MEAALELEQERRPMHIQYAAAQYFEWVPTRPPSSHRHQKEPNNNNITMVGITRTLSCVLLVFCVYKTNH